MKKQSHSLLPTGGQVLVLICHFIFEFPLLDGVSQPEGLCPWRWDGPCGSTTALTRQSQSRSGPAGAIGRNFPAVDLFLCGPQAAIDSACTNCGIRWFSAVCNRRVLYK